MSTHSVTGGPSHVSPGGAVHEAETAHEAAEPKSFGADPSSTHTVVIDRPRDEIYAFVRSFENFPRFMQHLEQVFATSDGRTHWLARAPHGRTTAWDAAITEDEPGRILAWRSVEGAPVHSTGRFTFRDTSHGTEVAAAIGYEGERRNLFDEEPKLRRDLRQLKQLIETGETTAGPHEDDDPKDALIFI